METTRKTQTDNLLKAKQFFDLKVSVSEHKTLSTSRGIIKDRMLKGESEYAIYEYLKNQDVIAAKRFTTKKEHETIETNTILLTFNSVTVPKSLRIFYRIIAVTIYVPNPIRCFNCQRFGHHEVIENFITNNDICLMNDKSYTYIHYPTGSFSSIDFSLCHPSLFLDFSWSVCKDQHHSDHFPILIESNASTIEDHNPKMEIE